MSRISRDLWTAMEKAVYAAPEDDLLDPHLTRRALSPWAFWVLIGLVRYRSRQQWATAIVRDRLGIAIEDIVASHSIPWKVEPQDGIVPGIAEWTYQVGGSICELSHRLTGETIRVAYYEDLGQVLCGRHFEMWLASLRSVEAPERRLRELHPWVCTVSLAIRELVRAGLLIPFQQRRDEFLVANQVIARLDLVAAFCEAWGNDAQQFGLAVAVGDWLAAARTISDSKDRNAIRVHSEALACQGRRVRTLVKRLGSKRWGSTALTALSELQADDASNAIAAVLAGDRIDLAVTALEVIRDREDARWCPSVRRLFERLDPNASRRQAEAWRRCAEVLLRHGRDSEDVLESLAKSRRYELAEVALLALRYDAPRAPALFQRALRSKSPSERTTAAAMLGILDEDWSRRLMLDVLRDSDGIFATAECRSALAFSGVPEVRRAVAEWEQRHESMPELQTRELPVYLCVL